MSPRPFATGLHLPECPRWHDGALWLSDMWGHEVLRYELDGSRTVVHRFPDDEEPGGLGWLPDGRMLVVGMEGRVVYRLEDGAAVVHADLRDLAVAQLNDMVVAADGTAYVSQFGFDMWAGGAYAESALLRVAPDGTADVAAEAMASPNGVALTERGTTLVVAEPAAGRLSRFHVRDDGSLDGRELVELEKAAGAPFVTPDGICVDRGGGIWAADPIGRRVIHVADGFVDRDIPVPDAHPLACVLGGPDRRTLFVCTAEHHHKPTAPPEPTGRVLTFEADVPGEGRP